MPTEENQRLRDEQGRRDELVRSTRAQADAMAAARTQRQRMDEIKRIQGLGMTVADARGVDTALQAVQEFDPSGFGEMESMATNAKNLAASTLEMRLVRVLKLELPGAIEEAYALDAMVNEAAALAHLVPVHEIDWDEPPAIAPLLAPVMTIPTPLAKCDSAVLRAFRVSLHELRLTRPDAEIRILFDDELAVMPGRYQK